MPSFSTLGSVTPVAVFLDVEIHKLHRAFTPAADIHQAQACKLNSSGLVIPIVGGTDVKDACIGYAMNTVLQASGDQATIIMRGYTHITGEASATMTVGPVKYTGYNTTTGRPTFSPATIGTDAVWGHALEAGASGAAIEIVLLG